MNRSWKDWQDQLCAKALCFLNWLRYGVACIFSVNSQIAKISFVQLSEWQQKDWLANHRGLSSKSQFWRSQLQLLNLPQPLQFSRKLWMNSHHPCCHHLSETQLSPGVTDGCHRCQVLHISQSMMWFVWVRFPYFQCVTCFERCCRISLARWRVYTLEARRVSRSKLCPLLVAEGEEAFKLSIQHIGRSPLFTPLSSLMLLLSGMGEDAGLLLTASELPPVETPSKRELNLLESRFFKVSLSSSSVVASLFSVCFLPGLRPRAPRVFK